MEKLALEMETSLKVLAVIGFNNPLRDDAAEVVNTFQTAGIKVNMLTGDNFENALNCACNTKIININKKKDPYHLMNFKEESLGMSTIKSILKKFQDLIGGDKDNKGNSKQEFQSAGIKRSMTECNKMNKLYGQALFISGQS